MSQRLCRACGGWHEHGNPWPRECMGHFKVRTAARSDLPRPTVISDTIESLQSMVSGERFDSKAELRRHYRANGVVEVGNETINPRDNDTDVMPGIETDLAQTFNALS